MWTGQIMLYACFFGGVYLDIRDIINKENVRATNYLQYFFSEKKMMLIIG